MGHYVLSPLAGADLDGIYDYTYEQWGAEQFDIYRKAIAHALEEISSNPYIPGSRSRDDLFSGCRIFRVKHHYLVYRVQNERVEIGRILHKRMNFDIQVTAKFFG